MEAYHAARQSSTMSASRSPWPLRAALTSKPLLYSFPRTSHRPVSKAVKASARSALPAAPSSASGSATLAVCDFKAPGGRREMEKESELISWFVSG